MVRSFPMVPGIDFAGTVREQPRRRYGRATGSCSTAGASARRTGAAWPRWPASRATGWCRCPPPSRRAGHGHRHRRLHRHAVRPGAGGPRRDARTRARCWSPAPPAASAAWRSPSWPGSATASWRVDRPARGGATTCAAWARPRSSTAPPLASPASRWPKERWAGGVDAVGSHTLANVLRRRRATAASVAACGLAQGMDLPALGGALHPARRHAWSASTA